MARKNKTINCKHQLENYSQYLVSPLDTRIKNFTRIVNYFEYQAPEIDCVHSAGKIVDIEQQERIFTEMMKIAKMQNHNSFIQRIQPNSFELLKLDGESICIKCPRTLCKISKNETKLGALLRHLRNIFAHGRTYIKTTKNQTYIVLEDYDKGKNPKMTAKIVCTKAILDKWKAILENQIEI